MKFVNTLKTQFYTLQGPFKLNKNQGKCKIKEMRMMEHN